MLTLDFTTKKFHWVEIPPDDEGFTFKVLTLDDNDDVVVFARTTSRESAETICKEFNGENVGANTGGHRVFG